MASFPKGSVCPPVQKSAKVLCAADIGKDFAPAVTGIKCVPTFRVWWENFNRWIEEVNGATHLNAGIFPIATTGFFTAKGYIVSTFSPAVILAVASAVMTYSAPFCWEPGTNEAEPTIPAFSVKRETPDPATMYKNRYHTLPGFVDVLKEICNGGAFSDWFEFYVDVTRVNRAGVKCAHTYRATLCGVDFESGLAWFRIMNGEAWNRCLEPVVSQTILKYGNSRRCLPGSDVYTVYYSQVSGPHAMSSGIVSNNHAMMYDQSLPFEAFVTNMQVDAGAEGAPILNSCGQVVAVIVGVTERGCAIGISSSFIERIHNAIVDANCSPTCGPHAIFIEIFGFYIYKHGSLQFDYHPKSALDLSQALLRVAVGDGSCRSCKQSANGCCNKHDEDYLRRQFYSEETCQRKLDHIGIVLQTDPCGTLSKALEECAHRDPNFGTRQKRFFQVRKGDLITHIHGIPVGDGYGQQTPENIFYSLTECTCVTITFFKENEEYTMEHTLFVDLEDNTLWIEDFNPCCVPCLKFDPLPVVDLFSKFLGKYACQCGFDVEYIGVPCSDWKSEILPLLIDNLGPLLDALNCWSQLMEYFLNMLPAVTRAAFFSNLTDFMTKLNGWISLLVLPQPMSITVGDPDQTTYFTPLSVGVTLAQLSRNIVGSFMIPTGPSVRPVFAVDYVSSLPKPNRVCTYKKTVPNYLALIGSKLTQCARSRAEENSEIMNNATTAGAALFKEPFSFPVSASATTAEATLKRVRDDEAEAEAGPAKKVAPVV